MTKLEFLQTAFSRVAALSLTHAEAAIILTLTRFSGMSIPQMSRIIGTGFQKSALADLGRKGFIAGKRRKGARNYCYSLTEPGIGIVKSILEMEATR